MLVRASAWKRATKAAEEIHGSYAFMDEVEPTVIINEYIKGIEANGLEHTPFLHPRLLNLTHFDTILSLLLPFS
jgi:hypothetical protein